MAEDVRLHVVRQGEDLHEIARQHGVTALAIRNHPDNASLWEEGRTAAVLAPRDVVTVPVPPRNWMAVSPGGVHTFVATRVLLSLRLSLLAEDGTPMAGEPWEAPALKRTGTTDGAGMLTIDKLETSGREIEVHLTRSDTLLRLRPGHLDPASTDSGFRQRLAHLGYLPSPRMAPTELELAGARDRFCSDHAPGATTDADTQAALVRVHGS